MDLIPWFPNREIREPPGTAFFTRKIQSAKCHPVVGVSYAKNSDRQPLWHGDLMPVTALATLKTRFSARTHESLAVRLAV